MYIYICALFIVCLVDSKQAVLTLVARSAPVPPFFFLGGGGVMSR